MEGLALPLLLLLRCSLTFSLGVIGVIETFSVEAASWEDIGVLSTSTEFDVFCVG